MPEPTIRSFDDFWPYYVKAHSKKPTRTIHAIGTFLALATAPLAIVTTPWVLLAAPVLGYGPAWYSHFFIEGNKPATFGYPLYSLRADFVMVAKILAGTMDAEAQRILAGGASETAPAGAPSAA